PVDSHIFPKCVVVPDDQFGMLAAKGEILRISSNRTKWMKNIVAPELRRPLNNGMRMQNATIAQLNALANNGISADLHSRAKFCPRRHRRLQVNVCGLHFLASTVLGSDALASASGSRSTILHISVASAASCPSTVALPSSLQKSPRHA